MKSPLAGKHARPAMAWTVMLIVSDLPDILMSWLGVSLPPWMFWAKVAFLALFFCLTRMSRAIRPLWQYALALLTLFLALGLTSLLRNTAWFQDHFNTKGVSFFKGYAAVMVLDILVAMAVIAALWLMKGERRAFFLVKGRLAAPIEPIRWLGIKAGESWKTFTWIFAGIASMAVAVPTILGIVPSGSTLLKALPLLPACILLAAVNAFTEEAYTRCSLLSTLHGVIGKGHALLLSVVYFGLGHWLYGSPPGLLGAAMVGFLAWLLGKAMLETRGFVWPWLIHFVPDAVIFFSYALLFVQG